MSEKNGRFKNWLLLIIAALVMGITPLILFCTPIRDKIPAENRIFVLILFEGVFFSVFFNLIYSVKKQQPNQKTNIITCATYSRTIKYIIIFLFTATLSYFLLSYNHKVAAIGALLPLLLFWFYRTFKSR